MKPKPVYFDLGRADRNRILQRFIEQRRTIFSSCLPPLTSVVCNFQLRNRRGQRPLVALMCVPTLMNLIIVDTCPVSIKY